MQKSIFCAAAFYSAAPVALWRSTNALLLLLLLLLLLSEYRAETDPET